MASRATTLEPKDAGTGKRASSLQPNAVESVLENEIAALAYHLWQDRGCPIGSPEEDWFKAENALRIGADPK